MLCGPFCLPARSGEGSEAHHTEQPRRVVRQVKVLVFKLGTIDTRAAGPVAVDKVAALDHEMGDNSACVRAQDNASVRDCAGGGGEEARADGPVKDRVLVPYRQAVFSVFARAHLSKVLSGSVVDKCFFLQKCQHALVTPKERGPETDFGTTSLKSSILIRPAGV